MDLLVKNIPDGLIQKKYIDFDSVDELLNIYLDFREHSIEELPQKVLDSYNNFSEDCLVDLEEKYGN